MELPTKAEALSDYWEVVGPGPSMEEVLTTILGPRTLQILLYRLHGLTLTEIGKRLKKQSSGAGFDPGYWRRTEEGGWEKAQVKQVPAWKKGDLGLSRERVRQILRKCSYTLRLHSNYQVVKAYPQIREFLSKD